MKEITKLRRSFDTLHLDPRLLRALAGSGCMHQLSVSFTTAFGCVEICRPRSFSRGLDLEPRLKGAAVLEIGRCTQQTCNADATQRRAPLVLCAVSVRRTYGSVDY